MWGGETRYFQVSVIVGGGERGLGTRGGHPHGYLRRSGHAHFWVSQCKSLSHAEHSCPLTPTLPTDPGLRGWGPCLTPRS